MRTYTIVSGLLFLMLLLAHIARVIAEGPGELSNPIFDLTSLLGLGMAIWSYRTYRSLPGENATQGEV